MESEKPDRDSFYHLKQISFEGAAPYLAATVLAGMFMLSFFQDGAYFIGTMTLFVTVNWALLIMIIATGERFVYLTARREVLAAVLIYFLFWLWNGASVFWSISADESWIEFNRTGGYMAILLLGIYIGRIDTARRLAMVLLPLAALPALLYGLGSKLFPGQIENLINAGRINIPLGYVNAVGLLNVVTFILSLNLAASARYHRAIRVVAAAFLPVFLVTLFFTLSRGSMIALFAGVIALIFLSPQRLRITGLAALALAPAALIARWSSDKDELMDDLVDVADKLPLAVSLRWYLLGAVLLVAAVFTISLYIGGRYHFSRRTVRLTGVVVLAAVAAVLAGSAAVFVQSQPSFTGWVSDTYDDLRTGKASEAGAERLLSLGASQRFAMWEEALENWDEHLIGGTGAQTFPIVHLQKRASKDLFVKQPHGLPFRLLAELGAVGAALMLSFIPLVLAVTTRLYCRTRDRWGRGIVAAVLSVMIAYLVHTAYDWDWNMFALTGIYFYLTGIALGWYAVNLSEREAERALRSPGRS